MQGTEKQVNWAQDIKASKMADINAQLEKMAVKLTGKPAELAKIDAVRTALDSKDAAWWIDRRDVFYMDILKAAAAGK